MRFISGIAKYVNETSIIEVDKIIKIEGIFLITSKAKKNPATKDGMI
jgi:hypothetical protein